MCFLKLSYYFTAANIDEKALRTISREDLKDLFPGPENFFQRKKLWECISQMVCMVYIQKCISILTVICVS